MWDVILIGGGELGSPIEPHTRTMYPLEALQVAATRRLNVLERKCRVIHQFPANPTPKPQTEVDIPKVDWQISSMPPALVEGL